MKLIKLNNEFYLLSDGIPKGYYYDGFVNKIHNTSGAQYEYAKHIFPIVASTEKLGELPLLDRKKEIKYQKCVQNCFEALSGKCVCPSRMITLNELASNVDVKKLARELTYKDYTDEKGEFIKSTIGADDYTNGIVRGYNKALRDNADKKFTLDDMNKLSIEIWEWINIDKYGAKQNLETVTNNFIQSITKGQTQWEVDIEENKESVVMGGLRSINDFGGPGPQRYDYSKPIITEGHINILRIK